MSDYGQPPHGQPPGGGGGFGQPPGGGGFGQPPGQPPGPGNFGQPQPSWGQPAQGFAGPVAGQPPQDYKTAGLLMLISGIMNVLWSLGLVFALIWICVGVFWFITLAGAIFEIVVAASIMQNRPNANAKTASILGIITGILCGNVIGMVLEIVAVIHLGKPEVEAYLRTA